MSTSELKSSNPFTNGQYVVFTLLRVAIGWHFLYEGFVKLFTPEWSSAEYLEMSNWIFSPIFHSIAENPFSLQVVDFLNIWGLIFIGFGLILGLFTRTSIIFGMFLLALYYLANPPFVKNDFGIPTEGHYLIVNKNLIEFLALSVLLFVPTGKIYGLDRIIFTIMKDVRRKDADETTEDPEPSKKAFLPRRELLKGAATLPLLATFGYALLRKKRWESYEEKNLADAMTGASVKGLKVSDLKELNGVLPKAKIKGLEFSRLILGGNLLSGYSHSRDLIYVSSLVKAYHHRDKIFSTLYLAEKCGVNTLLTNPIMATMIDEYWKRGIGQIQFISDCAGLNYTAEGRFAKPWQEYVDIIKRAIDYGACACYIQGETADHYIENGQPDAIEKAMQIVRDAKIPVGIGAHKIETVKACVQAGLEPDFWMKTLHHHNYWSARHEQWHDNMYCFKPDETISYMKTLPQPWIAFKVMAAGAIHPKQAFQYAFENGADFICAGMYDFQMVEDVNIAIDVLKQDIKRERDWVV